jgi:hypothetical protein
LLIGGKSDLFFGNQIPNSVRTDSSFLKMRILSLFCSAHSPLGRVGEGLVKISKKNIALFQFTDLGQIFNKKPYL